VLAALALAGRAIWPSHERAAGGAGTSAATAQAESLPPQATDPSIEPAAPAPTPDLEPPDPARALAAIRGAKADPTDVGLAALVASLASDDAVVVAEAAGGLVARRAVGAIPALAAIDPHEARGAAPSLIDALGRLGGMAGGAARGQAVSRLLALMTEEGGRGAADSAGNLIQIYEALGETRDARAASRLETVLRDPSIARAHKVAIVQALERIGAATSRAAVEAERAQVALRAEPDALEEEIRQDLLRAMDAALASLP
jgi:hypothetical protein